MDKVNGGCLGEGDSTFPLGRGGTVTRAAAVSWAKEHKLLTQTSKKKKCQMYHYLLITGVIVLSVFHENTNVGTLITSYRAPLIKSLFSNLNWPSGNFF